MIVVLICISLVIRDVEHFYIFLLIICMSSLKKCLFSISILKSFPDDANIPPRLGPLSRGKFPGLELENLSSMSWSAPDWLFILAQLTSISSSITWSHYPAPPLEPWYLISPSVIFLLCKMGIILPHCYAHHLDQDILAIAFIVWPWVVILSGWVLGFFNCISLLLLFYHFFLLSHLSAYLYFTVCFVISHLTFIFKWRRRNSSSKKNVLRADKALVDDWWVFISLLSSTQVFPVSPKGAQILDHIPAEVSPLAPFRFKFS